MTLEKEQIKSPLKAIKKNCIECCGDNQNEVKLCTATSCPLYNFRTGHNPFRKNSEKNLTDEQRQELSKKAKERFENYWKTKKGEKKDEV